MSEKDSFFKTVNANINAEKAGIEAFKKDVFEFQKGTTWLLDEIQSWFDGSPITSQKSTARVTEGSDSFEVSTLILKNSGKTLTITPECLYFWGGRGSLEVSIHNLNRSPNTSKFTLHQHDKASNIDGWVIVSAGNPAQRIEFNQENFFSMIQSFA